MTLAFASGIELGTLDDWNGYDSNSFPTRDCPSVVAPAGEWSRWAARLNNGSFSYLLGRSRGTPTPINTLHVHRSFNGVTDGGFLRLQSPNQTTHVTVGIAGGKIRVVRGESMSTNVLATGTTAISATIAWHCVEIYLKVHDTAGEVKVWLDGRLEIDASGLDTRNDSGSGADVLEYARNTGHISENFDDFAWFDDNGSVNKASTMGRTGCLAVPGLYMTADASGVTQGLDPRDYATSWDSTIPGVGTVYAWYKLDETTGTNAADSSGSARDGTYGGSPSLNLDGKESIRTGDNAVGWDSSDDEVALPSGLLDIPTATSPWSAAVWIRSTSKATTARPVIAGRKSSSSNPINVLYAWCPNGTTQSYLRWDTRDDNGAGLNQLEFFGRSDLANDHAWNDGLWHLIVLVRDASKGKRIYFDGEQVASATDSMATGATSLDWSYIARDRQGGTYSPVMELSEVIVWREELSAQEVLDLHSAGCFNYEMVREGASLDGGTSDYKPEVGGSFVLPDNDYTYVATGTDNARDLYAHEPLPGYLGDPLAVMVKARVRKLTPGTRQAAIVLKDGGTEYTGSDQGVPLGWSSVESYYDSKPSGGAWTEAALDAAEPGVKARP